MTLWNIPYSHTFPHANKGANKGMERLSRKLFRTSFSHAEKGKSWHLPFFARRLTCANKVYGHESLAFCLDITPFHQRNSMRKSPFCKVAPESRTFPAPYYVGCGKGSAAEKKFGFFRVWWK